MSASAEHVHWCEQLITIDDKGLAVRIEHRDLPNEEKTLDRFFKTVGLNRGE